MSFLIRQTLIYAIPLMVVALAGIFAERSGIINLALEGIMIFGNWKPLNVAGGALLFGLFKCIAACYSTLDINGDGIYALTELGLNANFYRLLPYVITLVVLAFTSKSSRAPKAEGIPYDKGQR